jgi:hypothetical protein
VASSKAKNALLIFFGAALGLWLGRASRISEAPMDVESSRNENAAPGQVTEGLAAMQPAHSSYQREVGGKSSSASTLASWRIISWLKLQASLSTPSSHFSPP